MQHGGTKTKIKLYSCSVEKAVFAFKMITRNKESATLSFAKASCSEVRLDFLTPSGHSSHAVSLFM